MSSTGPGRTHARPRGSPRDQGCLRPATRASGRDGSATGGSHARSVRMRAILRNGELSTAPRDVPGVPRGRTADRRLEPVDPARPLAGTEVTICCWPFTALKSHRTLATRPPRVRRGHGRRGSVRRLPGAEHGHHRRRGRGASARHRFRESRRRDRPRKDTGTSSTWAHPWISISCGQIRARTSSRWGHRRGRRMAVPRRQPLRRVREGERQGPDLVPEAGAPGGRLRRPHDMGGAAGAQQRPAIVGTHSLVPWARVRQLHWMARHRLDREPRARGGRHRGVRPDDVPRDALRQPRRSGRRSGGSTTSSSRRNRSWAGPEGAITTNIFKAPDPLVDNPPGCWLHLGTTLHGGVPPDGSAGTTTGVFPFPSVSGRSPALIGGGSIVAAFSDRPEVRELVRFVLGPSFGRASGGIRSPSSCPPTAGSTSAGTRRSSGARPRCSWPRWKPTRSIRRLGPDAEEDRERRFWDAMVTYFHEGPESLDRLLDRSRRRLAGRRLSTNEEARAAMQPAPLAVR